MKHYWAVYLLVLPSMLIVGTFAYFPCASGIYHAFFRWNGDFIKEFVGLQNFIDAARDPALHWGFVVVAILVFSNLFKMIPSILAAVAINRLKNQKASYIYRVLYVIPMIIPGMVTLLIWKFFFDPSQGILNYVLKATGMMEVLKWMDVAFGWGGVFTMTSNPAWLGEARLIIPSLILWGFPWVGTTGVLIYLAGLQAIDESVYEASEIDGITSIRKFFSIELPLILTQVRINLILMIIATIQGYGHMLVLFGIEGGPSGMANVPGLYMYANAFAYGKAGYACAIGIILFVFILSLTWLNNKFVRIDK